MGDAQFIEKREKVGAGRRHDLPYAAWSTWIKRKIALVSASGHKDLPMTTPVCFFAFRSPYSRIGLAKLKAAGVAPVVIPFTGPPDGAPFFNPTDSRPKLDYYLEDIPRMTARAGLKLAFPDPFELTSRLPNLAFHLADQAGKGFDFACAASEARWGEGQDLNRHDVLAGIAAGLGLDLPAAEALKSAEGLRAAEQEARAAVNAHGVFGVPFLIADGQKYWGQDRFDLYLEAISA